MKAKQFFWSFLALLWLLPSSASDDPFAGFFSGELDGKRYGVTIVTAGANPQLFAAGVLTK